MTTAAKTKPVWNGPQALRRFLVAIADLEPFPGNPRRGDVASVARSLERFGQTRPILVDGTGARIVAGHHVTLAAATLDPPWTHVAAIPNEFASDDEALAFLLADNRTHDLGDYQRDLLAEHLRTLQATVAGLVGTGYSVEYLAALDRDLELARQRAEPPPSFPALDPDGLETDFCCPSCGYEWSGSAKPGEAGRPLTDAEQAAVDAAGNGAGAEPG